MDKNTRRKAGKLFISLLAIILVALLSIVSTIAYLSDRDGVQIHQFTLGEGVDVELTQDTGDPEEFYPGKEYPEKAAKITIPTTAMEYEYLAVKVQFFTEQEVQTPSSVSLFRMRALSTSNVLQFVEMPYNEFLNRYGTLQSYPEVASNTAIASNPMVSGTRKGWREYGGSSGMSDGTLYVYCGVDDNGNTGTALEKVKHGSELMLFDSIKINDNCNEKYSVDLPKGSELELYNQDGTLYGTRIISDDQLKGFRIVVTAYAVQGDIGAEEAQNALVQMMNGEIVPEISATPTGSSIVASTIPTGGGSIVVSAIPTDDSVTPTVKPTEDISLVTPTPIKDDNTAITNPPVDNSTEIPTETVSGSYWEGQWGS